MRGAGCVLLVWALAGCDDGDTDDPDLQVVDARGGLADGGAVRDGSGDDGAEDAGDDPEDARGVGDGGADGGGDGGARDAGADLGVPDGSLDGGAVDAADAAGADAEPDEAFPDLGPDALEVDAAPEPDLAPPDAAVAPCAEEERCDGLDNDCDGVVDPPELCAGPSPGFCRARARIPDVVCEDFPRNALRRWAPSTLFGGDGPPGALDEQRGYGNGAGAGVGGHLRYVGEVGDAFDLSFEVDPAGATIGVGVFSNRAGEGYGVWVGGGLARLVRMPDAAVLGRVDVDGVHRVGLSRTAEGRFELRVDGVAAELDVVDERHGDFRWLSTYAPASDAPSYVDDLVLRADVDGDGLFAPEDNCPRVANADQADPDGDRRGAACDDSDGDGVEDGPDPCRDDVGDACDVGAAVAVLVRDRLGRSRVWVHDVATGVRERLAWPVTEGATSVSVRLDTGQPAYEDNDAVRVAADDGGEAFLVAGRGAHSPQWLAGGCLAYSTVDPVGVGLGPLMGRRQNVPVGAAVWARAVASADGSGFAVVRQIGQSFGVSTWRVRGGCRPEQTVDWVAVPEASAGAVLHPHPEEARWLLVTDRGPLEVGGPEPVLVREEAQVLAAAYSLDGARVVTLSGEGPALRVGSRDGGPVSNVVWPGLGGELLGFYSGRVDVRDRDRDRVADRSDGCPNTPARPVEPVAFEVATDVAVAGGAGLAGLVWFRAEGPQRVGVTQFRVYDGVGAQVAQGALGDGTRIRPHAVWNGRRFSFWMQDNRVKASVLDLDHTLPDPVVADVGPGDVSAVTATGDGYATVRTVQRDRRFLTFRGADGRLRVERLVADVGPDFKAIRWVGDERFAYLRLDGTHGQVGFDLITLVGVLPWNGGSRRYAFDLDRNDTDVVAGVTGEASRMHLTRFGDAVVAPPAILFEDLVGAPRVAVTAAGEGWGTLRVTAQNVVMFRALSRDGEPVGPDVPLGWSGIPPQTQQPLDLAWTGDAYAAAWVDPDGVGWFAIGRFDCE